MRSFTATITTLALTAQIGLAGDVYLNTFDDTNDLDHFTVYTESFVNYDPPPLHSISIDSGQLRIDTDFLEPNSPAPPTLSGRAHFIADARVVGPGLNPVLSANPGPVTWGFNIRNQDGGFNNSFDVVLACTQSDPFQYLAPNRSQGYSFKGGGMLGSQMVLKRPDYGLGGGAGTLIDITNGLAPGVYGSFRIVYDPLTDQWSLYGHMGGSYVDPMTVSNLLGTAYDGTYTSSNTPYFGVGGRGTGTDWFDNLCISVEGTDAFADIKVNGSDEDITIGARRAKVSLEFNPGPYAGKPVRWWVFVRSPRSWQHFDYKAWSWKPGAGSTLSDPKASTWPETALPDYVPTSKGTHTFFFMALLGEGKDRIRVVDSVNVRFRRGR